VHRFNPSRLAQTESVQWVRRAAVRRTSGAIRPDRTVLICRSIVYIDDIVSKGFVFETRYCRVVLGRKLRPKHNLLLMKFELADIGFIESRVHILVSPRYSPRIEPLIRARGAQWVEITDGEHS
jgi:hypothetical protein